MNVLLTSRLQRHLPIVGAVGVSAAFLAVHLLVFVPLDHRWHHALANASDLGLQVDPTHPGAQLPLSPRLFSLLEVNSLAPAVAESRGQSGALTADMVQALSSAARHRGLETVVAEPGLLTQSGTSVDVRVHLRLRGTYAGLVGMLDDLSHDGRLWNVERFQIKPLGSGLEDIELWMSTCLLKRTGGAR